MPGRSCRSGSLVRKKISGFGVKTVSGSLLGGGGCIKGDGGGRLAFLRIGRRIVVGSLMIVGVAGGGHCRSGAGDVGGVVDVSRRGVLQRRCGCCLVGLAGVGGGCVAGRDWRGHSPAEGAGSVLRLAFPLFGFDITGFSFCSTLTAGWSVGSLYVSSILTWSRPSRSDEN